MPGTIPTSIILYRIIHIDNVENVLTHGICAKDHPNADPNYINIGDTGLIASRNSYGVKIIPPGGMLGEYVPFYFGPHSPMLLKIRDGYGGVTRRLQSEIVYLLCKMDDIVSCCPHWCFTNGHAKMEITDFFNSTDDLDKVDWEIVKARIWRNNDEDFDRMRRKQAEFLVKHHVPASCIYGMATFNEAAQKKVELLVNNLGLSIPVKAKSNWYY